MFITIIFIGLLLVFTFAGDSILDFAKKYINCPGGEDLSMCLGISVVVRYFPFLTKESPLLFLFYTLS
jgi:hypothetical protein